MGQKSTLIFFGCASRWAPPWACDPTASYGPELFVLYCFVTPANLFRAQEQIVRICSLFKLCRVAFADKLYQSVCVTPNCRRCASLRCMFGFKAIFDQRVQRHPEAKASQIGSGILDVLTVLMGCPCIPYCTVCLHFWGRWVLMSTL